MRHTALSGRRLIPGLTGLVLGCLPGAGLLLWSGRAVPAVMHPAETDTTARSDAIPAAYHVKPHLWETPNG